MFLQGLLSFLQITFVPGFILLHLARIKTDSPIQKFVYIFAFSLFINYSLVTILVLLGIYTALGFYLLISIELLCLFFLMFTKKVIFRTDITFKDFLTGYATFLKTSIPFQRILIIGSSLVILFYISLFFSNIGTVFYFVDTVNNIHWNTWAKDFANNILPRQSHHFPQLLPANWSIAYLLTGNPEINFFPKSIMPLFILSNLLMFLDLAITKKNLIFLIGLIIYGLLAPIVFSLVFLADGSADIPVAFFSFLTFYAYLKSDKVHYNIYDQLLIFLFAASAAATKLAGIYVFICASVLVIYGLIKHWKQHKKSDFVLMLFLVPFILGICFFWHLLKPDVMVTSLHQPQYVGENYLLIITKAAKLIYFNWGLPVVAFLIVTILGSIFVKESRYITLLMVIPPFIIWMLKYSVDFRNLSFVIPFISYVSAFGLIKLIDLARNKSVNTGFDFRIEEKNQVLSKWLYLFWIMLAGFIAVYFTLLSDFVYNFIFQIYKFISIYYFQSYRINMVVDYTPFIHVDFYFNTLGGMLIIISVIILLAIFKIRLMQFLISILLVVIFMNFTFADEESILDHHRKKVEQIDARNYASWIETIVKSEGIEDQIQTNFKTITTERIPAQLTFIYIESEKIENNIFNESFSGLLFLKSDLIENEVKKIIDERNTEKKYEILFADDRFMFIRVL